MSEHDTTEVDAESMEDFDAFWDSRGRKIRTVPIRGRVYTLPASLPLQFELEARKQSKSSKPGDIKKLVAILFGEGALEQMARDGLDVEQFTLLLAWAPQVIAGQDVTLAEVAAELAAMEAKKAAKGDGPVDPS